MLTTDKDPVRQSMFWARTACLALGAALVIWGLAPACIHRLITGRTPPIELLAVGSTSFTLGAVYLGLHVLIRRERRWAMWLALTLALLMLAASLSVWATVGAAYVSGFVMLLAGAMVATAILALTSTGGANRHSEPTGGALSDGNRRSPRNEAG